MNSFNKKMLLCLATSALCTGSGFLTGCDLFGPKESDPGTTDKVIKISYTLAGFGEDWIKEAVKKFNNIYEGHGYKAVLGRSDANFTSESVMSEIKYPEDNDYDLYFDISENIITQLTDASYSVLRSRSKTLLEDLSDLLNTHPINLSGEEEESLIGDLMNDGTKMYGQYTTGLESVFYGKTYGIQWTRAVSGLVINTDVLAQAGYSEAPRTTKEMFAMIDAINGAKDLNSLQTANKIYPVTWPGANAAGYGAYTMLTWLGQWKGYQGYQDFYSLTPKTGNTITNGYSVYDDVGIQYSWEAMYKLFDQANACEGTVTTIDHLTSEQILADGEALFAVTGDWCYNELIGCGYSDAELSCIEMFPVPVLSEIADLVGFTGDDATKDALLSAVIKGLDEDKPFATIATDNGVTIDQVTRIAEARGIYFDLGVAHNCIVPSYSDNIDGAKLFIRFCFSKDFGENVYAQYAHAVNANTSVKPQQTNYLKSLARISGKSYSNSIGFADKLSEIRMNGGINFVFDPYTWWGDVIKGMATKIEGFDSQTVFTRVKDAMENNWSVILSSSGVVED